MNNPWFRMYSDFLEDAKMISLAFEDQRHFIGVLALKSSGLIDQECSPDVMDRLVAQKLWVDRSSIVEVKRRLIDVGLIDENWQPAAWDKRQSTSDRDPTAGERQRRKREKEKEKGATVTDMSRGQSRETSHHDSACCASQAPNVAPSQNCANAAKRQENDIENEDLSMSRTCHASVTALDTDTDTDNTLAQNCAAESAQTKPKTRNTSARFDDFWHAYPNRKDKAKALGIWKRRTLDAQADIIIAKVRQQATQDRSWLDGYAPHPSTYLRNARWDDEIDVPKTKLNGTQPHPEQPPPSRAKSTNIRDMLS